MLDINTNKQLLIELSSDDVTKIYFFEFLKFFSHNLKEHHEIPPNLQNQLKVLRIG